MQFYHIPYCSVVVSPAWALLTLWNKTQHTTSNQNIFIQNNTWNTKPDNPNQKSTEDIYRSGNKSDFHMRNRAKEEIKKKFKITQKSAFHCHAEFNCWLFKSTFSSIDDKKEWMKVERGWEKFQKQLKARPTHIGSILAEKYIWSKTVNKQQQCHHLTELSSSSRTTKKVLILLFFLRQKMRRKFDVFSFIIIFMIMNVWVQHSQQTSQRGPTFFSESKQQQQEEKKSWKSTAAARAWTLDKQTDKSRKSTWKWANEGWARLDLQDLAIFSFFRFYFFICARISSHTGADATLSTSWKIRRQFAQLVCYDFWVFSEKRRRKLWVSVANSRGKLHVARLVSGSKSEIITAVQINTPTRAERAQVLKRFHFRSPTELIISRRGNLLRDSIKTKSVCKCQQNTEKRFPISWTSPKASIDISQRQTSSTASMGFARVRKVSENMGADLSRGKVQKHTTNLWIKFLIISCKHKKTNKSPADNVLFSPLISHSQPTHTNSIEGEEKLIACRREIFIFLFSLLAAAAVSV